MRKNIALLELAFLAGKLTIRERKVLEALYEDGLTVDEIAKLLRITKIGVREYEDKALCKLGQFFVKDLCLKGSSNVA